jgi:hypothetical protein
MPNDYEACVELDRMAMGPTERNIQQVLGALYCLTDKFLGHEADQ